MNTQTSNEPNLATAISSEVRRMIVDSVELPEAVRDLLLSTGRQLIDDERYCEARSVFNFMASFDSENAECHCGLGICLERTDCLDEALECFNRAIELDPAEVYALAGRAGVQLRQGDRSAARIDLDKAKDIADTADTALIRRIEAMRAGVAG